MMTSRSVCCDLARGNRLFSDTTRRRWLNKPFESVLPESLFSDLIYDRLIVRIRPKARIALGARQREYALTAAGRRLAAKPLAAE